MSIRLSGVVEYDGAGYAGFQRQPDRPTIQGEIEGVLSRLTRQPIRILGAGRTDAGVHARGQVIAFDTDWSHSIGELHRGLNALLPDDIAVRRLERARDGFHPRFDAISRTYRYQILNQPVRSPLWARYAYHVARPLDVDAMQQATRMIVGTHDFATFGQPTQGESTVREVMQVVWEQNNAGVLSIWLEANGFLRSMVRCIVGTAVQVGLGEMTQDEFAARFTSRDRSQASAPAPPQGLCLMAVRYANDSECDRAARVGEELEGVVAEHEDVYGKSC
jgi:tRNA pseudouridine38-40 synthase